MQFFKGMNFERLPKDYFLFGSFREKAKGNLGKHNDFIPGPTKIKRDTATKRWKRIVKDHLGIDVNMYSNKHSGANAKILAGIDLALWPYFKINDSEIRESCQRSLSKTDNGKVSSILKQPTCHNRQVLYLLPIRLFYCNICN
jgi:hypothetical protein